MKTKTKAKEKNINPHTPQTNLESLSVCVAILGKVWIDLYPFAANRRGSAEAAEAAAIAAQIENQLEDQIWELIQKSRLPHNDKLKHCDRREAQCLKGTQIMRYDNISSSSSSSKLAQAELENLPYKQSVD